MQILELILDFIVYVMVGAAASYYYYGIRKKEILGGFWVGVAIGTAGAVIIGVLTGIDAWFIRLINWLMQPKFGDQFFFRVNLIAALIGSLFFVYILNRINHDRDRR